MTCEPDQPAFVPVELEIGQGLSCFGELRTTPGREAAGLCILLHDEGLDLDDLKWLAATLSACGISQLLVDLPGHGLSNGDYRAHSAAAVAGAYAFARTSSCPFVGLLAHGSACQMTLRADLEPPPLAVVLLAPRSAAEPVSQTSGWIDVPKLVFVPNDSPESSLFADDVMRATHAWCLRADLEMPLSEGPGSSAARVQIGSISAKFLLEQAVFARSRSVSQSSKKEEA